MNPGPPCVLTINGGSSSIRFAIYEASGSPNVVLEGKVTRIGTSGTRLEVKGGTAQAFDAGDHRTAARGLLDWLEARPEFARVQAAGHRVVHGMQHQEPERVTPALLEELRGLAASDPDHLPAEIALMEVFQDRHASLPQVACFDTAFHRTLPRVAQLLPLPRWLDEQGVRRYGFHGLSYAFLMEELARLGDPAARQGRVILAHLGSGASMAAVRDGVSIDTSMGFTPCSGLPMSTRSGDLDAGLAGYLARSEGMTIDQFHDMVNHESGLLGVSGISPDIRDLLDKEGSDVRATEAVELFCYQAKKCIGSLAAALGGVDALVFAGGIGENSATIRSRICAGLQFLGIELDETLNQAQAPLVSKGTVRVRVIPTNEERMIARSTARLLGLDQPSAHPQS